MPAMLYMYMKNKSLEQNKGKVNMTGYLRTRDGIRNQYFWRNVRFQTEKHLNTEELELIEKAKVLKVGSIPVPEVKSDDKTDKKKDKKEKTEKDEKAKEEELEAKKKLAEEGPKIEYDKAVWKAEEIENMHAIPANINNEFDVYLMSKNVPATWEYVEGEDFDDYGYHDVLLTGPELREIATMHRVIENEDGSYRDVYVPIFLVMWDDKMSADRLKGIPPIDVTRDDGIAGLVKAIGVEERTTAGELNSITEQVMVLENEDKDIDDLSATLARKKALDFINAEKRLTMFDIGMLGTVSTLTAIIFAVVMFLLGFSMGG